MTNICITSEPNILPPKTSSDLDKSHKNGKPSYKTMSTYWVNKSNSPFPSQLAARRLRRLSGQKKHLVSACLFLCSLCIYSLLSLIFFFFPLSTSLFPAAFSHTQAMWWRCSREREKDLGDHLKPIMAVLQPPRNSVTDGDLVFIAGVIGNTQTHTHTHTHNTHTHRTQESTKKETL